MNQLEMQCRFGVSSKPGIAQYTPEPPEFEPQFPRSTFLEAPSFGGCTLDHVNPLLNKLGGQVDESHPEMCCPFMLWNHQTGLVHTNKVFVCNIHVWSVGAPWTMNESAFPGSCWSLWPVLIHSCMSCAHTFLPSFTHARGMIGSFLVWEALS